MNKLAKAVLKAHRSRKTGLAYPMSIADLAAALSLVLKAYTLIEEPHK